MDFAQTILFIVIIVLAIFLMILGVQVFFILRDLRKTVSKANKVLDNTNIITQNVSAPISSLSSIAMGFKTGSTVISFIKKILSKDDDDSEKGKSKK